MPNLKTKGTINNAKKEEIKTYLRLKGRNKQATLIYFSKCKGLYENTTKAQLVTIYSTAQVINIMNLFLIFERDTCVVSETHALL